MFDWEIYYLKEYSTLPLARFSSSKTENKNLKETNLYFITIMENSELKRKSINQNFKIKKKIDLFEEYYRRNNYHGVNFGKNRSEMIFPNLEKFEIENLLSYINDDYYLKQNWKNYSFVKKNLDKIFKRNLEVDIIKKEDIIKEKKIKK